MILSPFDKAGRFFRGNLHCHSTRSDGALPPEEVARRARAAGAFVAIAHPQWYGLTLDDARTLAFADAIEVYNHTCAVQADRPDGTYLLDGIHLNAIATDDAHFRDKVNSNADAFGGWVMVKSETLSPNAILAALQAGDFYASQGPELCYLRFADGHLQVESSYRDEMSLTTVPPLAAPRFLH